MLKDPMVTGRSETVMRLLLFFKSIEKSENGEAEMNHSQNQNFFENPSNNTSALKLMSVGLSLVSSGGCLAIGSTSMRTWKPACRTVRIVPRSLEEVEIEEQDMNELIPCRKA